MGLKKMKKEELELLSNKDITNLLLEDEGNQSTADLFKKIISLLELPKSTFDAKIGDYFTALTTDKRFILLEDGTWDLRSRHTSDKIIIAIDDDDDEDDGIVESDKDNDFDIPEDDTTNYDATDSDEDDFADEDDGLKDLVVLDADELELEQ